MLGGAAGCSGYRCGHAAGPGGGREAVRGASHRRGRRRGVLSPWQPAGVVRVRGREGASPWSGLGGRTGAVVAAEGHEHARARPAARKDLLIAQHRMFLYENQTMRDVVLLMLFYFPNQWLLCLFYYSRCFLLVGGVGDEEHT